MKNILIIGTILLAINIFSSNADESGSQWVVRNDHYYSLYFMCKTKDNPRVIFGDFVIPQGTTSTHFWPQILPKATWECNVYDLVSEAGIAFIEFKDLGDELIQLRAKSSGAYFFIEKLSFNK